MRIVCFFLIIISFNLPAQEVLKDTLDSTYREDQFYASITYNILSNGPDGFNQSGISTGFNLGFIRDMPINKKRNWAIGLGLGLASNSYNQNLRISKTDGDFNYSIIDESAINVSKNKFTRYLLEVPLELRWRTSTTTDYKFWRIYTGLKFGYLVYSSAKFKSDIGDETLSNIDGFNNLQFGLTLSAGYNTWNFQVYYGLNPLFKNSATINGEAIDLNSLRIGIIFYIL